MLYGRFPFEYNNRNILEDCRNDNVEQIIELNLKFYDEVKVDNNIKNLFKKLFVVEPKERIKLNELLNFINDESN